MRPTLLLIASCFVAVCATSSPPVNASSCVTTEQRDDLDHMQIDLDFKNECTGSRICKVTWSVKCDGKIKPYKEAVALATNEVKTLTLSAAGCDGNWAIQPPNWYCRLASSSK